MATIESHDGSPGDPAFHVEQHGIDFIPESERWATPRNIGALWAGSAINVEYFIYGALLMGFGFSFYTALSIIILGNLSFFLLGLASLQGPEAGTTAFIITRASFGTRGSRLLSFFNWITQLGFETEGLILIVGAAIVLSQMAGVHVSSALKVVFIVLAAAIQAVMPYLGHATMVKILRALIIPFGAIFVLLAVYDFSHGSASFKGFGGGWELYTAGPRLHDRALGTRLDRVRQRLHPLPSPRRQARARSSGGSSLATALPEIAMMILGAATFTFLSSSAQSTAWNGANPFEVLHIQHTIPSWVVVLFLIFAIVQLFGINSLDLYSSGVSLQAMGLRLKRYQAVVLDSAPRRGSHDLRRVPVHLLALHEGVRRGHHRLDRAVVRHHDGRLAAAQVSLQRVRTAAPGSRQPLLRGTQRHQLERDRRLRGGTGVRDAGLLQGAATGQLPLPLDDAGLEPLRRGVRGQARPRGLRGRLVRRGRLLDRVRDCHRGASSTSCSRR